MRNKCTVNKMMKNDETVGVRLPRQLRNAIERERQRVSKAIGTEVKMSTIIRAALEERFVKQKARAA